MNQPLTIQGGLMTKLKSIIITLFLLILLSILTSCNNICENKLVKQITTSDNKYTAIAFIRDAGATTAFSPQVSLFKVGHNLTDSDTGNIFIGNNSDFIDIEWKNENTLIIKHKCPKEEIHKKEIKLKNINIEYIKLDDNN